MSSQQPSNIKSIGYVLGVGAGLGFVLALPLAIFIFLGAWIDSKLEIAPIGIIVSVIIGIILTIVNLYKIIIPFLEKRSKK
jgi:hypothetical protein